MINPFKKRYKIMDQYDPKTGKTYYFADYSAFFSSSSYFIDENGETNEYCSEFPCFSPKAKIKFETVDDAKKAIEKNKLLQEKRSNQKIIYYD